MKEDIGELI